MASARALGVCLGVMVIMCVAPDLFGQMGGSNSLSTFTTNDFSGSGNCAMCHSNLMDSAGNDVSIDTHWRSTMMGNAGKDPLWQAKVSSEILRNPSVESVINDKCTRCHNPMARVQALTDGQPVTMLGDGFFNPANTLHAAAMEGVSCTLCHQIADVNLGMHASFTGLYTVDTSTVSPDRAIYGPFSGVTTNPMKMHVGYTPMLGGQVTSSAMCGTCHTLYTPTVDAAGNVLGEFPEQMTYLEWKHANAGGGVSQTCQQCHLPAATGSVKISTMPKMLAARSPFGQHHLVGGNAFMLGVLKDNATELGVTATAAHFDATGARVTSQLETSTADITIASAEHSRATGLLTVVLGIQNKAGHKVPSGIPLRRCWIRFTVTDAVGSTLFDSGQPMADGSIAGNDADLDANAFEPHYDRISSADQVQIYEPIMQDSTGAITYTWLRAADYLKDNRLLPGGFDKGTSSTDIAVVGEAASDANFTGGGDQVTYEVDVAAGQAPYTVTATLLYQGVSYRIVQDLKRDSTPLISRFSGYYDAADKTPAVVGTAVTTVTPGTIPGDVDGDGHVDVVDLLYMVDAFGSLASDASYDARCDFNSDDTVDVVDLLTMVENWDV